ncbi:MAG TPA: hypothetical protein P5154_03120 [Candidatus Izemoplasmatales bacterium]|nr:hypothetical protein [Bacillota bacterium]HRY77734.1 hypothetical protein [Candidatus Izemoplasmatales bacterium]
MGPERIIFIVVAIVVAAGFLIAYSVRKHRLRREQTILAAFREIFPQADIRSAHGEPCDFRVETPERLILVKIVLMGPENELIITNPDFWCINSNPRTWSRSSAPVLIPGVKSFREYSPESAKRVVKIGLIYPDCANISRYLNESEVELVRPTTDVNGMRIIRFPSLSDFFAKDGKK